MLRRIPPPLLRPPLCLKPRRRPPRPRKGLRKPRPRPEDLCCCEDLLRSLIHRQPSSLGRLRRNEVLVSGGKPPRPRPRPQKTPKVLRVASLRTLRARFFTLAALVADPGDVGEPEPLLLALLLLCKLPGVPGVVGVAREEFEAGV